jgi:hypothetical protein
MLKDEIKIEKKNLEEEENIIVVNSVLWRWVQ